MKYNLIIAAIDFSDSSRLVLRHAAEIRQSSGGRLNAVHVVPVSRLEHWKESLMGQVREFDLPSIESELADLVNELDSDVSVETMVVEGRPAEEIKSVVADSKADLLVVAANDMTKARLGTVSARCVRTVGCDVLVLRDWQGGAFKKILVGVDFTKTSGEALRRACLFATLYGAQIEVAHVMYPPEKDSWGRVREQPLADEESYVAQCKASVAEAIKDFVDHFCEDFDPSLVKTTVLSSELPSAELTHHISKVGADLVVIGTRRLSDLESVFIGTNAERLLHDSPVSVLTIRA